MKWVSIVGFWGFLAFLLTASVVVGMGRQGWAELRHEMRKRRSK